jgi:two-component system NtrC family response regulator
MLQRVERYASFDLPVLFEGETGTGKSILARHLHGRSERRSKPFSAIDVGALDDDLAGAELFGHVKGAFTGAATTRAGLLAEANTGTAFLDEIGKATTHVQKRLLRVIDSGQIRPLGSDHMLDVNLRIVSATNIPIDVLVAEGRFLPDLAARVRACTIHVPALREHREDIPLLVRHYVARLAPRIGYAQPPAVDERLMRALIRAPWHDNVRGLAFAVERLLIEAYPKHILLLRHCDDELRALRAFTARPRGRATVEQVKRALDVHGSARAAASELGVSLATVYRMLGGVRARKTEVSRLL